LAPSPSGALLGCADQFDAPTAISAWNALHSATAGGSSLRDRNTSRNTLGVMSDGAVPAAMR